MRDREARQRDDTGRLVGANVEHDVGWKAGEVALASNEHRSALAIERSEVLLEDDRIGRGEANVDSNPLLPRRRYRQEVLMRKMFSAISWTFVPVVGFVIVMGSPSSRTSGERPERYKENSGSRRQPSVIAKRAPLRERSRHLGSVLAAERTRR